MPEKLEDEAKNSDKEFSNILIDLMNKIDARINNNYDYFQLRVLYYLTPAGRERARRTIFKPFLEEGKDGYYNEIKINDLINGYHNVIT